jgi:hypothetical protein
VRDGDARAARALAQQAVALADETDLPNYRGAALQDLAEVLVLVGDRTAARAALARALAILEAKGNAVWAAAARASLSATR